MRGVTQVTVTVRHTVSDATVRMGVAKMTQTGMSATEQDLDTIAIGSSEDAFTVDVTDDQGHDVELFLLIASDTTGEETVTIDGEEEGNIVVAAGKLHFPAGHGLTSFGNTGDRWAVAFETPVSADNQDGSDALPAVRTVIKMLDAAGDTEVWVWPTFTNNAQSAAAILFSTGNYNVTVWTLGKSTIQGIKIADTVVNAYSTSKGKLLPGLAPVARNIAELYRRSRETWRDHTPILHAGPTYDLAHLGGFSNVVSLWGEHSTYDDGAWSVVGSCFAGGYDRNNIEGGTTRYRNRIRVRGYLLSSVGTGFRRLRPFPLNVRASLYSYSGGWTGSATNGTAVELTVSPLVKDGPTDAGYLWGFGGGTTRWSHYLRGASSIEELESWGAGLLPFDIEVEDDQTTATDRMLRIEVKGTTPNVELDRMVDIDAAPAIWCVAFTAFVEPGSYGT
jgi:hypothetical protein